MINLRHGGKLTPSVVTLDVHIPYTHKSHASLAYISTAIAK